MIRILICAFSLAMSSGVMAKSHYEIDLGINANDVKVVSIDTQNSFAIGTAIVEDNWVLSGQVLSRQNGRFVAKDKAEYILPAPFYGQQEWEVEVLGGKSVGDELHILVGGYDCSVDVCKQEALMLFSLDRALVISKEIIVNGEIDLSFAISEQCNQRPTTSSFLGGMYIHMGCGRLLSIDDSGVYGDVLAIGDGSPSKLSQSPWYFISEEGFLENSAQVFAFSSFLADGGVQVSLLDEEMTTLSSFSFNEASVSYDHCEITPSDEGASVLCLDIANIWLISADGNVISDSSVDYFEPTDGDYHTSLSTLVDGRHYAYVNDNIAPSVQTISGDSKKLAKHQLSEGGRVKNLSVSNSGIYLISSIQNVESNSWSLSIYDFLNSKQGPYFTLGFGATLGTNQSIDMDIKYQDEDFSKDQIMVEFDGLESFMSSNEDSSIVSVSPYHDNVGEYVLSVSISNPNQESASLDGNINVVLTDYQLLMFEPTLFDRLELDEPVSVSAVVSSLRRIQVLEDDEFTLKFSAENRTMEELGIEIVNLPEWLSFDGVNLTGVPEQKHVGRDESPIIVIKDAFSIDGVARELKFPLEIIEVDEDFVIKSDGTMTVRVGGEYSYTIDVVDEETEIGDMFTNVERMPEWMSFDDETKTFSGTPVEENVGVHLVQVQVRDEGGFGKLHSFSVTVKSAIKPGEIDAQGGAISVYLLIGVGLIAIFRRFKR